MAIAVQRRDYSLTGPENKRAQDNGLASAEWYASPVPRETMRQLMKRSNGPAIRDTLIWFAGLAVIGYAAYLSWGSWWAVPLFFLYGILYASPGDSRWHECGHGTAFKTPWMNEAVYQIASFFVLRSATPWRWSHFRHHSDTIIVGRDPEIITERPPIWKILCMQLFHLYGGPIEIKRFLLHTVGKLESGEKEYIPESEYGKVFREARVYMLIIVAVIGACVYTGSLLPAMFVVLPSFYGNLLVLLFGMTQHLGLYEDVLDHRLNTRTMYMNPVFRFLYWNMNYHTEHHMFPMVPYHALPKLHQEMKADCPQARPSLWSALTEVTAALRKQKEDPAYVVVKPLPETARPYRFGPVHSPVSHAPSRLEPAVIGAWIYVCEAAAIEPEDVIRFDLEQRSFAIYRTESGNYHATDGYCTHQQVHLADGLVRGNLIECPKHNGRFDVTTGEVRRRPPCVDLCTYPVKIEEGKLFVQI